MARALAALAAQVDPAGRPIDGDSFEVLLLANNCHDDSAAIAARFAAAHSAFRLHIAEVPLPPQQSNIGFVRRELMDAACARLEAVGAPDGIIASTDGDTCVAPDWLAANHAEIAAGADAVGGRILTDDVPPLGAAALRLKRLDFVHSMLRMKLADRLDPDPFDPWPRHHQHFGASLAVTASAYRRAGGIPAVEFLEDEALVQALIRAGCRVRRSPTVRVVTSSRLDGRAAVGLAWQLRQWSDTAAAHDPPVEDPAVFAAELRERCRQRRERRTVSPAENCFAAGRDELDRGRPPSASRPCCVVPMSQAIVRLRRMLNGPDRSPSAQRPAR